MSITEWPPAPDLQRSDISFNFRDREFHGHLVAPPASVGPRPLIMVIHNYQGLKFFDVDVAEYLARIGYVGLAIDCYGDILPPEQRLYPTDPAQIEDHFSRCFTAMVDIDHDFERFRALLQTWLDKGLAHPGVDDSIPAAAIGYCFGGEAVLEAVRGGLDLGGVVSFHGLLQTGEDPSPAKLGITRPPLKTCDNVYNTNTLIVIENGADDHLVPLESQARFFEEMDAAGVDWNFHHHAKTPHGFALATSLGGPGNLHEAADRRSTMNMLSLFREIFPGITQNPVAVNAAGTEIPL